MSTLLLMSAIQVMTSAEVAERLDVTVRTIARWAEDGRLTPIRERPALYDSADVDKLAAELAGELRTKLDRLEASA